MLKILKYFTCFIYNSLSVY